MRAWYTFAGRISNKGFSKKFDWVPAQLDTSTMTTPSLNDALQTILAGDYGLNEGDHLKLCSMLKKAHDESKKGVKTVKEIDSVDFDVEIRFAPGHSYHFTNQEVTHYVQSPGTHIGATYRTTGTATYAGATTARVWNTSTSEIVKTILMMNETNNMIGITKSGIHTTWNYPDYIKATLKRDIMEKKARKKFGDLEEGKEESDHSYWRGDYTYYRFVIAILSSTGISPY
jgi:hypothetical protein